MLLFWFLIFSPLSSSFSFSPNSISSFVFELLFYWLILLLRSIALTPQKICFYFLSYAFSRLKSLIFASFVKMFSVLLSFLFSLLPSSFLPPPSVPSLSPISSFFFCSMLGWWLCHVLAGSCLMLAAPAKPFLFSNSVRMDSAWCLSKKNQKSELHNNDQASKGLTIS